MLKLNLRFLFAVLVLLSNIDSVLANQGQAVYQQCLACHGANGEGNSALSSPALAGQSKDYLIRQLQSYQSGIRGTHPNDTYGMQMTAMVSTLNEETIAAVSVYLSEMKPLPAAKDTTGDEKNG